MNNLTFRLNRMDVAFDLAQGSAGDDAVQNKQLALIIHHAQMVHVPVLDWLLEKMAEQQAPKQKPASFHNVIICAQCGQSFKSIAALNGHQRVHKKGGAHE